MAQAASQADPDEFSLTITISFSGKIYTWRHKRLHTPRPFVSDDNTAVFIGSLSSKTHTSTFGHPPKASPLPSPAEISLTSAAEQACRTWYNGPAERDTKEMSYEKYPSMLCRSTIIGNDVHFFNLVKNSTGTATLSGGGWTVWAHFSWFFRALHQLVWLYHSTLCTRLKS